LRILREGEELQPKEFPSSSDLCLVAEGENMFLASADPSNSDIPRKTMIRLNKQEKLLLLSLLEDFTAAVLGVVRPGFILTTLGDDSNQYTNGVATDNGASVAMVVRDLCCLFSGTNNFCISH